MAKQKNKINITKDRAEKVIMDFQDLVMQCAAHKGLTSYGVPEMLKNFGEMKRELKYAIESSLNAPSQEVMESADAGPKRVSLDLTSNKKYTF